MIEAGLLAVFTGLPILSIKASVTVRIIVLCLTVLPLTMAALIGVNGGSLSSFIFQFFVFLRNRRVLSRHDNTCPPKQKRFLPSLIRCSPSSVESAGQDEPPKSRRRFHLDIKSHKVTQFKTFLAPETENKPLNPLAEYIPIEKIENGIILTKDNRYVKLVEVIPVNFLLRSAQEQRSIIYSFISYLKIAPV